MTGEHFDFDSKRYVELLFETKEKERRRQERMSVLKKLRELDKLMEMMQGMPDFERRGGPFEN